MKKIRVAAGRKDLNAPRIGAGLFNNAGRVSAGGEDTSRFPERQLLPLISFAESLENFIAVSEDDEGNFEPTIQRKPEIAVVDGSQNHDLWALGNHYCQCGRQPTGCFENARATN